MSSPEQFGVARPAEDFPRCDVNRRNEREGGCAAGGVLGPKTAIEHDGGDLAIHIPCDVSGEEELTLLEVRCFEGKRPRLGVDTQEGAAENDLVGRAKCDFAAARDAHHAAPYS